MYGAGGQKRVADSFVSNYSSAIPPLQEQKQIAAFLDYETAKIDALIEKQQQLIALLGEKRQAVISHAVTKGLNPDAPMRDSGVEWLGMVPEHWTVGRLSCLINTRKGVAFKSSDFVESGVQVVKASDIKQLSIRDPATYLPASFVKTFPKAILNVGELVLSTVGSSPDVFNSAVGQIARVPQAVAGSLLNQNTVVFNPNEKRLANAYLFFLVQSDCYREHLNLHAHGTANQSSLNVSDMLNFKIPLPPLPEQNLIAEYISQHECAMELIVKRAELAVELLQERRTALISAAVTGKIDVRGWKRPTADRALDAEIELA
jgi:type I restriction enzyme S subunit